MFSLSRLWLAFSLSMLVSLPKIASAQSSVLRNPSNGHYYEVVSSNLNWYDAKAAAEARTYLGVSGHLATITTAEEEAFINTRFGGTTFWMGAIQSPGSVEPAGGFSWVTAEPFVYTDWNSGEPNNAGVNGEPPTSTPRTDALQRNSFNRWNDVPADTSASFLVEYDVDLPYVVSVSPQGAIDKAGTKRTFTLTVADSDGPNNIKELWLLINDRLNWGEGATLIYVPSGSSPTDGLLYLRRGDEFLPPIQIGTGSSPAAVLDNGAVRVVGSEVGVTTSGDSIILSLPLTIRDGLVGQNRIFARAQDKNGGVDPASVAGEDGFVRFGSYTVNPQFSGETNSAPTLSKLSPGATYTSLNTAGVAPGAQRFVFYVKDENGTGDIESLWFLAGKKRNWSNSATFVYQPRTRRLFLRSDDGSTFLGGGQIGQAGIIENSQVRVDLSKVQALVYADGKSYGLSLLLQAKAGLLGQNKIWLRTQDRHGATAPNGDDQGFVQSGTWSVVQGTTPPTGQSSSGSS